MQFEDIFWSGVDLNEIYEEYSQNSNNAQVRVFITGMKEFNRIDFKNTFSSNKLNELIQRINNAMYISINREIEKLEKGMSFLASIGSVAPFIGLLGTVWGIVNAFQSIAMSNNTSLAVVAPGIAEALFATALGLLAAIPAVAAYNKFSNDLDKFSNNLEYFSIEFSSVLLRQIEER
jgi:biopolymer transport protein TolQ